MNEAEKEFRAINRYAEIRSGKSRMSKKRHFYVVDSSNADVLSGVFSSPERAWQDAIDKGKEPSLSVTHVCVYQPHSGDEERRCSICQKLM